MNHYHAYHNEYLSWYRRMHDTTGEAFDPTHFVQLAQQQWSNRPQLAAAFARCTAQWPESELYTHFVAPLHRPACWKFAGSLFLDHPTLGTLLVDVLHDTKGLFGDRYRAERRTEHLPVGDRPLITSAFAGSWCRSSP